MMGYHWHYEDNEPDGSICHLYDVGSHIALCGHMVPRFEMGGCASNIQQERESSGLACDVCTQQRDLLIVAE